MENQWEEIVKDFGLETYEGYKKIFLAGKHYSNKPERRGSFKEGDIYVSMDKAIEALKLTEKAMMKKYEKTKNMQNAKVLKLKTSAKMNEHLNFKEGQEFEVVNNVVYMGGFPIPSDMQPMFREWINNNPQLFVDDTRVW
jgi:hypothetical protein